MRYEGDVIAVDGAPYRARIKTFRLSAGHHVVRVAWSNYQVPEWAGTDNLGESGVMFLESGEMDLDIDVEPNRYYQVIWPSDDHPGGPEGFRDVTVRR
jgi:hypothetical protein